MALAGELMRYIGNEFVPMATKTAGSTLSSVIPSAITKTGTSLATKAGTGAVNKILVSQAPSVANKIPVLTGDDGNISLYRGIKAETPELLQQYIDDMMNPNIKPRTYEGSAYGEGYYFTPHRDGAEGYASNDLYRPYQAVLEISPPKGRFLGINKANKNRPVDFTIRAENRGVSGGKSLEVGERDYENYLKRNGILGNRVKAGLDDSIYVISDNDALKGMKVIGTSTPGRDWEYNSSLSNILPSGSKVKFDKDLNISSIEKPSLGRGWFASNENNPHIAKAIKQSGADKYLGEPKVSYSLVEEPDITLYHGTNATFEDFDEGNPVIWFSDSDKHLDETGMQGSDVRKKINVVKRKLPRDLKLADEDLADNLTKQQLLDRGYAGVYYPNSGPNGDETYYEIFRPYYNKSLEKIPEVQQSLYGGGYGGYGSYDENVKRIGSSDVAPVREETLPDGWKELEKYLDTSNDRLSLAIGKPRSKITKQDLINFLEDYGYDTEGTKDDLWKNALMCIDDMAVDDLYNAGGSAGMFLQERLPFRHNDKLTDATNYYIGAKGRTGRLDAEYSDRLGIGRSNTPMSDRLVNPRYGAGGDYSKGAFGTDATWASGESGVSTSAHERMHAWQDINNFDWDEEVGDAIDELRGELKKFYHDEDTIKKYWGNSKTDYYKEDIEQEARMLQSYLDNEGYTNTYRKTYEKGTEWGDEVKPAFDKFFKKLRALSKKGIALPAVAGLVGIGTLAGKKDDKNVDNLE